MIPTGKVSNSSEIGLISQGNGCPNIYTISSCRGLTHFCILVKWQENVTQLKKMENLASLILLTLW